MNDKVVEDLRNMADRIESGEIVVESVSVKGPQYRNQSSGLIEVEYIHEENIRMMRATFDEE